MFSYLYKALIAHGCSNLEESRDVGTLNVVYPAISLSTVFTAGFVDVTHDGMELFVHFFTAPAQANGVLSHFQTGSSYAASVCSFARGKEDLGVHKHFNSFGSARHIRGFAYAFAAIGDKCLGIFHVQFVLSGARDGNIHFHFPRTLSGEELGAGELIGIIAYAVVIGGTKLKHVFDLFGIKACFVVDIAVRTEMVTTFPPSSVTF